jgi:hypothetical protein
MRHPIYGDNTGKKHKKTQKNTKKTKTKTDELPTKTRLVPKTYLDMLYSFWTVLTYCYDPLLRF